MGVLKFMAAGAAEGLGRGIASMGAMQMASAQREDDERRRLELTEARQRQAAPKATAADELSSLADALLNNAGRMAPLMALGSGGRVTREQADDVTQMLAGEQPTTEMPAIPEAGGGVVPDGMRASKYTPGEAAKLMEASFAGLRRMMGVVKPEAADNIAAAEMRETQRGLVQRYAETGDPQAARGALVSQGKDLFGPAGDVVTGEPGTSTVAESTIRRNDAVAGATSKKASTPGRGDGMRDEREALQQNRMRIQGSIKAANDLIKQIDTSLKALPDAKTKASLTAQREQQMARITQLQREEDELGKQIADLSRRASARPSAGEKSDGGSSRAAPPAPRDPAQREKGRVYSTPKGDLRWMGTGWARP